MNTRYNHWILAACLKATLWALTATAAIAAESSNVCARASLTNPDSLQGVGGMGGTGIMADAKPVAPGTGGMGGTGAVADVKPVVPGTGGMGGTGIVGVITGFASICVNGVELHYDANTPVSINGRAGAARDLAVGQVVAVQARITGDRLQANGIGVIDAVSGPVTRVNAATRELQVMGQTVRTDSATSGDLTSLRVGAIANVSGHRGENGDIIASRIDSSAHVVAVGASLLGTVTRVEANALIVNGTRVNLSGHDAQGINAGSEVFVSGEWNGKSLQARRVDVQPVRNAIARNERAILEGYVRGKTAQELNVGGIAMKLGDRVRFNGGNDRDADVGRKVQVEVRRSGNDWQAERVTLPRDDRPSRPGREGASRSGSGESSRDGNEGSTSGSGSSSSGSSSSGSSSSGSSNSGSSGSGSSGSSSSGGSGSSGRSSGSSSGSGSNSGSGRSGRR